MKQALTSPQGIAGLLFLVVGFVLGLNYDPAIYKQKDTQFVTDAREYSKIARENLQKGHEGIRNCCLSGDPSDSVSWQ